MEHLPCRAAWFRNLKAACRFRATQLPIRARCILDSSFLSPRLNCMAHKLLLHLIVQEGLRQAQVLTAPLTLPSGVGVCIMRDVDNALSIHLLESVHTYAVDSGWVCMLMLIFQRMCQDAGNEPRASALQMTHRAIIIAPISKHAIETIRNCMPMLRPCRQGPNCGAVLKIRTRCGRASAACSFMKLQLSPQFQLLYVHSPVFLFDSCMHSRAHPCACNHLKSPPSRTNAHLARVGSGWAACGGPGAA